VLEFVPAVGVAAGGCGVARGLAPVAAFPQGNGSGDRGREKKPSRTATLKGTWCW